MDVVNPALVASNAAGEAVNIVDSAVLEFVAADAGEAADTVDPAVVTSTEVAVSLVDPGSNVLISVAVGEDMVDCAVVISTDTEAPVGADVSTPVISVAVDGAGDKVAVDVVTSSDTGLPAETVVSGEVTPSLDTSVETKPAVVTSVPAEVTSWVVISEVSLNPETVASVAPVDNEAVAGSDVAADPANPTTHCSIHFHSYN